MTTGLARAARLMLVAVVVLLLGLPAGGVAVARSEPGAPAPVRDAGAGRSSATAGCSGAAAVKKAKKKVRKAKQRLRTARGGVAKTKARKKVRKAKRRYRAAKAACAAPVVGAPYAGGIYVGTTQDDTGRKYALVASPPALQFAPYAFDPYLYWDGYHNRSGTYRRAPQASNWDGLGNTQKGAAVDADYQVFRHVSGLAHPRDGGSPWYVPAKYELNLLWTALGESGLAFNYQSGGNSPQVIWLWSSTEHDGNCLDGCGNGAWFQQVRGHGGGSQSAVGKDYNSFNFGVRPVRRIPL